MRFRGNLKGVAVNRSALCFYCTSIQLPNYRVRLRCHRVFHQKDITWNVFKLGLSELSAFLSKNNGGEPLSNRYLLSIELIPRCLSGQRAGGDPGVQQSDTLAACRMISAIVLTRNRLDQG